MRSLPPPILLALCLAIIPEAPAFAQSIDVRVENPSDFARPDEIVSLDWAELRNRIPDIDADNVRVLDAAGAEVLSQPIDNDGDGSIDALLFLARLAPTESRTFTVEAAPAGADVPARVHVKHDDYRDDMAWESDRMAYRTYGQGLWNVPEFDPLVSSGIDVWLKRVPDLIVERWYEKGAEAYHIDTGEGADFYSVGTTLGNGGTAIWADDELHRAENFADYRIIANGPIRAIFEMTYEPWQAGSAEVSEVKRITVDAGQHLFKSESTFQSDATDALTATVGFVKRAGVVGATRQVNGGWAWLSTWGPVQRGTGGHGDLGGVAVVDRSRLVDIRETDDHYLALLSATPAEPVTAYVGAGWTAAGDFSSAEDWWEYLNGFAAQLTEPVMVTLVGR